MTTPLREFEGVHNTDNLERQHLQNLAEMGEIEDELGRDITARLEELEADLPVNTTTREDRLHLAMSCDFQTIWMRPPLYDSPYDGKDDIDPPCPYDCELGSIVRFINGSNKPVTSPTPFTFIDDSQHRWFFMDLKALVDRREWIHTRLSRNRESGCPTNRFLEVILPLPLGYPWPSWASGIHCYLFGEIVETYWRAIFSMRMRAYLSS